MKICQKKGSNTLEKCVSFVYLNRMKFPKNEFVEDTVTSNNILRSVTDLSMIGSLYTTRIQQEKL